ncbi:MAG: hypothetical protein ACK4SA_06960, partial [Caldilinea sp.]
MPTRLSSCAITTSTTSRATIPATLPHSRAREAPPARRRAQRRLRLVRTRLAAACRALVDIGISPQPGAAEAVELGLAGEWKHLVSPSVATVAPIWD